MDTPQLSIIMPVIGDHGGPRDVAADWCFRRWEALCHSLDVDFEFILETHKRDDGPTYHLTAMGNRGADRAKGHYLLFTPADMFLNLPEFDAMFGAMFAGKPVILPHRSQLRLPPAETDAMYAGDLLADCTYTEAKTYSNDPCFAITATAFRQVNGFDERFRGYGCEEHAFMAAVRTLIGEPATAPGSVYHLHHPGMAQWPGIDTAQQQANVAHWHTYQAAAYQPELMLEIVKDNRRS